MISLLLRAVTAISFGTFVYTTKEILENPKINIQIGDAIGYVGKIVFLLPYLALIVIVLKTLSLVKDLGQTRVNSYTMIFSIGLVICDLFYSSFIFLKDNIKAYEYKNNYITVNREITEEEKKKFIDQFGSNLNLNQDDLIKIKDIDMHIYSNYSEILDAMEKNIVSLQKQLEPKSGMIYNCFHYTMEMISNHPYITTMLILTCIGSIWYYYSNICEIVGDLTENLIQSLKIQKELAVQSLVQVEINKVLAESIVLSKNEAGMSQEATNQIMESIKVLNEMLIKTIERSDRLGLNCNDLNNKVNESLLLIIKLVTTNPKITPNALAEAMETKDFSTLFSVD